MIWRALIVWVVFFSFSFGDSLFGQAVQEKPPVLKARSIQENAIDRTQDQQGVGQQESKSLAGEKSVKPGINKSFIDPELDVDAFIKRFEIESREVYITRKSIVEACEIEKGDSVADVGAGTGLFTRLFSTEVGDAGWVYAVDIAGPFLKHIS